MKVLVPKGRYVVAVSGGVDSMVLLHVLSKNSDIELIVAHYDHGIRHDSEEDRQLVQSVAKDYGLKFVYDEGNLGPDASESMARKSRYEFLHKVRKASESKSIITAHHQDDLLETAVINLLRGTDVKGLASIGSNYSVLRPAIDLTKKDLMEYAKDNNIVWREDYTNQDVKYLRNYIRHKIIPNMTNDQKEELLGHIRTAKSLDPQIDEITTHILHLQSSVSKIDRKWFISLPYSVSRQVMNTWLKKHNIKNLNKKRIVKLVNLAKTSVINREFDLDEKHILRISKENLSIIDAIR